MGWTVEVGSGRAGLRALRLGVVLVSMVQFISPISDMMAQGRAVPNGQLASGTLSFDGHATVGDFTGTTNTVTGRLTGAPELTGVRGWVEASVQTLKTGDGKRDKDLNKSMESSKYPNLRFDLTGITSQQPAGDSIPVVLHGTLAIHGVTRPVELPGAIAFHGSNARVRSDFPLNLKDYKIGGLSKMLGMLKMDENIEVHVDLMFSLGSGRDAK